MTWVVRALLVLGVLSFGWVTLGLGHLTYVVAREPGFSNDVTVELAGWLLEPREALLLIVPAGLICLGLMLACGWLAWTLPGRAS